MNNGLDRVCGIGGPVGRACDKAPGHESPEHEGGGMTWKGGAKYITMTVQGMYGASYWAETDEAAIAAATLGGDTVLDLTDALDGSGADAILVVAE